MAEVQILAIFAKHGAFGILAGIAVLWAYLTTRKNDKLTDRLIDLSAEQAATSRETNEAMRNLNTTVKERTEALREAIRDLK